MRTCGPAERLVGRLPTNGWSAACTWAGLAVVSLRLALGVVMGLAWLAIRPYLPAEFGTEAVALGAARSYGLPADAALQVWPRWDAVHYLALARHGYLGVSEGDTVFYPLYPWLLRATAPLLGGDYLLASQVVSAIAAFAALAVLYHLAERRYGTAAARWSVVALALYPTAFFLLAPFTEGLFLALTLGAFAAAEARRWWLAAALGALGSLARGPGVLTALPLAWIAWEQWSAERGPTRSVGRAIARAAGSVAAVAAPVAAGAAFLLWRQAMGFAPMAAVWRTYSGLEIVDPARGLVLAAIQAARVRDLPTALEVASAGLFLGLGIAMAFRARWRVPAWLLFTAANLAIVFSKHSVSASSLQSLARYVLVLFPAFITMGDWLAGSRPRTRLAWVAASSTGLLLLSGLYAVGVFVG